MTLSHVISDLYKKSIKKKKKKKKKNSGQIMILKIEKKTKKLHLMGICISMQACGFSKMLFNFSESENMKNKQIADKKNQRNG